MLAVVFGNEVEPDSGPAQRLAGVGYEVARFRLRGRSHEATVTNKLRRRQCVRKHDPEIPVDPPRPPSLIYWLLGCDPAFDRIANSAQLLCLSSLEIIKIQVRSRHWFAQTSRKKPKRNNRLCCLGIEHSTRSESYWWRVPHPCCIHIPADVANQIRLELMVQCLPTSPNRFILNWDV